MLVEIYKNKNEGFFLLPIGSGIAIGTNRNNHYSSRELT